MVILFNWPIQPLHFEPLNTLGGTFSIDACYWKNCANRSVWMLLEYLGPFRSSPCSTWSHVTPASSSGSTIWRASLIIHRYRYGHAHFLSSTEHQTELSTFTAWLRTSKPVWVMPAVITIHSHVHNSDNKMLKITKRTLNWRQISKIYC